MVQWREISEAPCRWARARRGATAVEFALVAPIFLILVMGVFEMSRAMWIKATLQFAVEETARYAIVNISATTSTLETYAASEYTASGLDSTAVTFSASLATSGGTTYVTITGTHTFSAIIPLVPFPDVTLSSRSRVPLPSS